MKGVIDVRSQTELDCAISNNLVPLIDFGCTALPAVFASQCHAKAFNSSVVVASSGELDVFNECLVFASGDVVVRAYGRSIVYASAGSTVYAYSDSKVFSFPGSNVMRYEHSKIYNVKLLRKD